MEDPVVLPDETIKNPEPSYTVLMLIAINLIYPLYYDGTQAFKQGK